MNTSVCLSHFRVLYHLVCRLFHGEWGETDATPSQIGATKSRFILFFHLVLLVEIEQSKLQTEVPIKTANFRWKSFPSEPTKTRFRRCFSCFRSRHCALAFRPMPSSTRTPSAGTLLTSSTKSEICQVSLSYFALLIARGKELGTQIG